MTKIANTSQSNLNALGESLSLTFALPVGILSTLVWLIVFATMHTSIALQGWPSIGAAVIVNASIITFFGFCAGYTRGRLTPGLDVRKQLTKPRLIFNCLTLATAYTIIVTVLTSVIVFAIVESFKGLVLPPIDASIIVGVFATATMYAVVNTSVRLQSRDIVNALTIFVVGGVFASMATAQNPYWWQANFSSLGTTTSFSSFAFNITLILSGLLLLCLTSYLLADIHLLAPQKTDGKLQTKSEKLLKLIFVALSLCMAGVGLFPWNKHPLLHNLSAYLLIVFFTALILALPYLIKNISKTFLANSYFILISLLVCLVLWQPLGYFGQTAFELIAFSLTFAWLVLFFRTIGVMRAEALDT